MNGRRSRSEDGEHSCERPGEAHFAAVTDSHPESAVHNSQPAGIGRVVALDEMCAWNNLGRNVVFADHKLEILGIFDETHYPLDDELSQYDLDVHAIIDLPSSGHVLVLNHLGIARIFRVSEIRRPGPPRPVHPRFSVQFEADVERSAVVGDRIVGSAPRSLGAGGLIISEPLMARTRDRRLDADACLETYGEVGALAALPALGDGFIVVGGDGWVALHSLVGGRPGRSRWHVAVDLHPAGFMWDGELIWVAGSDLGSSQIDDYDWEKVGGGGFAGLASGDGRAVVQGRFTRDLAWGNGGVAVVKTPSTLCGIGRRGELCVFNALDGTSNGVTPQWSSHPLGIAHAAVIGDQLVYGWNRDGYRLHRCALSTIAALADDP
jgi:hypothetical protein